ncbi:MAG: GMC family oxidoreductase [Planctomycetota bacterium]
MRRRCEVLIVGSGPGGAACAEVLAGAGLDVLILDAGPSFPPSERPAFSLGEMVDKYWNRGVTFTLGSPVIAYALGRCVGGGSEVNNGEFISVPKAVLESWRANFGVDVSDDEIDEGFRYFAKRLHAVVEDEDLPAAAFLRDGATRLGWRVEDVLRCHRPSGESVTTRKGLLSEAIRSGANVVADSQVLTLERNGTGWRAEVQQAGAPCEIKADQVFVCAGAIESAALLQRSGHKTAGRGFQCQPMLKLTAEAGVEINDDLARIPSLQVKQFAPELTFGCSVSRLPFLVNNLSAQIDDHEMLKANWKRFSSYYVMLAPRATGRVTRSRLDGRSLVRYRLGRDDLSSLARGMHQLGRLLFEAGARRVLPSVDDRRWIFESAEALKRAKRLPRSKAQLTAVHLSSTCRMGSDPRRCVVDDSGRVFGANGMYVADASVLPTAPSVNPQATILTLARRIAERALLRHQTQSRRQKKQPQKLLAAVE